MRGLAIAIVVFALVGAAGTVWRSGGGAAAGLPGFSIDETGVATAEPATAADEASDASPDRAGSGAGGDDATPEKSIVYQWVDERGSVHFADSLEQVPADWRGRAGQIELDPAALSRKSAAPGAKAGAAGAGTAVAAGAAPSHEVVVYTAPWCGWCRKTMAFLDERGVDYHNKDVEADPRWAEELHAKTGGGAVPLVEIDGTSIPGYDPVQMAMLLE